MAPIPMILIGRSARISIKVCEDMLPEYDGTCLRMCTRSFASQITYILHSYTRHTQRRARRQRIATHIVNAPENS